MKSVFYKIIEKLTKAQVYAKRLNEEQRIRNTAVRQLAPEEISQAIFVAVKDNDNQRISEICINREDAIRNFRDADGNTVLHIAARKLEKHADRYSKAAPKIARLNRNSNVFPGEHGNILYETTIKKYTDAKNMVKSLLGLFGATLLDVANNKNITPRAMFEKDDLLQRCYLSNLLLVFGTEASFKEHLDK